MSVKIKKNQFAFANQSKLLLTLDWLTLNVEDNFKSIDNEKKTFNVGKITVERVEQSTRHFNKIANLWLNSEKIAVVTFDARTNLILKGRAHIKFENHLFYNNEIKNVVDLVVSEFSLKSIKVSRVDLACDGVCFHNLISKYELNKYKKNNGLRSVEMGVQRVNDLNNIRPVGLDFEGIALGVFDSFTVGSYGNKDNNTGKSYRFARYYNKSKEIADLNHKEYIKKYHDENGFQGTVYRFEIEYRSEFLSQVANFNYSDLFDFTKLCALFRTGCKNFFEYRYTNDENISRCTPVEMFAGLEESVYTRVKRVVKKTLRPIQQMVKRLIIESTELFAQPKNSKIVLANSYLNTVRILVNEYNLSEWLAYRWQWLCEEMQDKMNILFSSNYKIPDQQLKLSFYGA